MKPLCIFIFILTINRSKICVSATYKASNYYFITPSISLYNNYKRSDFGLQSRLTKKLFNHIRRKIKRATETPEQKRLRIEKEEKAKRDGLLYPPKTSYELYIATERQPLEDIRNQFGHILSKLKNIGAEDLHIYSLGTKPLVRPIKKKYQANFLLVNITVYPSLIDLIRRKLLDEKGVLRILVLRNDQLDKEKRIYRDKQLYVRHPYFSKEVYKPYLDRLKDQTET